MDIFLGAWVLINIVGTLGVSFATLMGADEDRLPLIPLKVFFVYSRFWKYLDGQQINLLGKIIATVMLAITFGGSIICFWLLYVIILFVWFIVKMFPVVFRKRKDKKSG